MGNEKNFNLEEFQKKLANNAEKIDLLKDNIEIRDNRFFKEDFKGCKKKLFEEIFGEGRKLSCESYDQVISGRGGEGYEIDCIHSSALQALLVFGWENLKITYEGIKYDKIYFEFENKVITYPSSMDVVLVSENNDSVIFVESKFKEIFGCSHKKGHSSNKVIGELYFTDESGYKYLKFNVEKDSEDLKELGIIRCDGGKSEIIPINDNLYVYADGIKQELSHLIGIKNYISEFYYKDYNKLGEVGICKYKFITLYNDLPMYKFENKTKMLDDFINHWERVRGLVKSKNEKLEDVEMEIKSYKKFIKECKFDEPLSNKVIKYYSFDEENM